MSGTLARKATEQAIARRGARLKDTEGRDYKVLTFDIECSPHIVHAWNLRPEYIGINQIVQPGQVIGVGVKWYHEKTAQFYSDFKHGHEEMIRTIHGLLNEADIIVGFNSRKFDIKHLNREFLMMGLPKPKINVRQHVDLLPVARREFAFPSNKLDYLAQQLGLGSKMSHEGHNLWVRCMAGDPEAWGIMASYCRKDVALTEQLYDEMRGWLGTDHPHVSMFTGSEWGCPACGETDISTHRQGETYTFVQRYPLYECPNCHGWVRGNKRMNDATHTRAVR